MTDEEKHLEVMKQLENLNTKFDEVIKPAVKQTYVNKDDIIRIKSFQSIIKYVGTLVSGLVMFITIRSIWSIFKH